MAAERLLSPLALTSVLESPLTLTLLPPSHKDTCDDIGPTCLTQATHLKILNVMKLEN